MRLTITILCVMAALCCLFVDVEASTLDDGCDDGDVVCQACKAATESCFEEKDEPGCNWSSCCEYICEMADDICCSVSWDMLCQSYANAVCIDCNENGIIDDLDVSNGDSADCNSNFIPDECDIAAGVSPDCNDNGRIDGCEIGGGDALDCNSNWKPDECDIADGTSADCNGNGVVDDCEVSDGTSLDCNGNGIPDSCDISEVASLDCNGNLVPDECDISDGTSTDLGCDGVPDECELAGFDCNGNESSDALDIASGLSSDLDEDGIPDECEGAMDVVFVLDVTGSKSSSDATLRKILDDLGEDDSLIRSVIRERSNGDVRFGLVSFRDRVYINQVLTGDESLFLDACDELESSGGGEAPEASDRALLEVLLEGGADSCDSDPYCCDGAPDVCELPSVCIDDLFFPRFDVPFRQEAGRLVVHLTDTYPGGCDDYFDPLVDEVFARRIAELAGEKEVRIVAIADREYALEFALRYAVESNGELVARCSIDGSISIQAIVDSIRNVDFGGDCPADLDGNGVVEGSDLTILLASWGLTGDSLPTDLNGDGEIGGSDLAIVIGNWGSCS